MNTEVMFSSRAMDWATPQAFFDQLDSEFHFTPIPALISPITSATGTLP